jgi:hypothetical protein
MSRDLSKRYQETWGILHDFTHKKMDVMRVIYIYEYYQQKWRLSVVKIRDITGFNELV